MSDVLSGVVTDNGLADAPAAIDPPEKQTSPVATSRDGAVIVRLSDAGGLPEGALRFTERLSVGVPTTAPTSQFLVAGRPGWFLDLVAENIGAVPGAWDFLQIHDSAELLANGAVPVDGLEWPLSRDHGVIAVSFQFEFTNGLVIALSTTQGTFTSGSARLVTRVTALVGGG
jgi:hypothetical protein